jgi:hypothetical protein
MELWLRAHNDDPRVPVLINPAVVSTIIDIRFSGTPFDCCFIPLFFLQTLKENLVGGGGKVGNAQRFPSTASFPPRVQAAVAAGFTR